MLTLFFQFNSFISIGCKRNNCEYGCVEDLISEDLIILSSVKGRTDAIDFPLPEILRIDVETEIRLSSNQSSYIGFPSQGILHDFEYENILQRTIVGQFEQSPNIQTAFGASHVLIDPEVQNEDSEDSKNSIICSLVLDLPDLVLGT